MALKPFLLLGIASALSACAHDDTAGPTRAELTVSPEEVRLTALNQSISIKASRGGQSTMQPAIELVSDLRWLDDRPVLDPDSLSVGRLRAVAPGKAQLRVSAFGHHAAVTVHVQPEEPIVMYVGGSVMIDPSREVPLRGYRLGDVTGEITLGGTPAQITYRDSAEIRVSFPDLRQQPACSVSPKTILVSEAEVIAPLEVHLYSGALFELEIGEMLPATHSQLQCFILPPHTRYALAYYDPSLLERSRVGYEYRDSLSIVAFRIGAGAAAVSREPIQELSLQMDRGISPSTTTTSEMESPHMRSKPWARDELVWLAPTPGQIEPSELSIYRIYDDHYVLAIQTNLGSDTVAAVLEVFDSIMPAFIDDVAPLYQMTFSERLPVTSSASNQFLLTVVRSCFPAFAVEREDLFEPRSVSWVTFGTCHLSGTPGPGMYTWLERLLHHELAHAWSFLYAFEQISTRGLGGSLWGLEGVADLMVQEVARRRLNIGPLSNYDVRGQDNLYARSVAHRGMLANGYHDGASFLRDLLSRRLLLGEDYNAALLEIARGGVDGWYGFTHCCDEWLSAGGSARHQSDSWTGESQAAEARLPGLVARMRKVDSEWEPEEAVLLWTMSYALDELTENPDLQVHSFFDVVAAAEAMAGYSWLPDAELRPNSPPVFPLREAGSSGYSYLVNDEDVGLYQVDASFHPSMLWRLARYK
jgi:hypothetical protein